MPEYLFVYGTLMTRHGRLHPLLEGRARLIGGARARGNLFDLGSYPAFVPAPTSSALVQGEVYELDPDRTDEIIGQLDRHEGADVASNSAPLYRRVRVELELDTGQAIVAWTYEYTRSLHGASRIVSGDYRDRD